MGVNKALLSGTTADNTVWLKKRYGTLLLSNMTLLRALNGMRSARSYLLKQSAGKGYPLAIKVETADICNLSCPGCMHGNEAGNFSREHMISKELFGKLIDEIGPYLFMAIMYHRGEPFFNRNIFSMIESLSRYNVISTVSTNFSLPFKAEDFRNMVSSGLRHLLLSIDGTTQEIYEKYRRGGDLALVKHNVQELVAVRRSMRSKYPIIEQQFILFEHNYHQWKEVVAFATELGIDRVSFVKDIAVEKKLYIGGFHRSEHEEAAIVKKKFLPLCQWPWFAAVVRWNGEILPCCDYDWMLEKSDFGNITTERFMEVWNSKRYAELRASLSCYGGKGKIDRYCAKCPSLTRKKSETMPKLQ